MYIKAFSIKGTKKICVSWLELIKSIRERERKKIGLKIELNIIFAIVTFYESFNFFYTTHDDY